MKQPHVRLRCYSSPATQASIRVQPTIIDISGAGIQRWSVQARLGKQPRVCASVTRAGFMATDDSISVRNANTIRVADDSASLCNASTTRAQPNSASVRNASTIRVAQDRRRLTTKSGRAPESFRTCLKPHKGAAKGTENNRRTIPNDGSKSQPARSKRTENIIFSPVLQRNLAEFISINCFNDSKTEHFANIAVQFTLKKKILCVFVFVFVFV